MNYSSSDRASLGRAVFLINARDALSAIGLAFEAASNHYFSERERASPEEVDRIMDGGPQFVDGSLAGEISGPEDRSGGGAWRAETVRVAWPDDRGAEQDAQYHVASLAFEGPEPHARPDASDSHAHWAGVAASRREARALTKASDGSNRAAKAPAPRL